MDEKYTFIEDPREELVTLVHYAFIDEPKPVKPVKRDKSVPKEKPKPVKGDKTVPKEKSKLVKPDKQN